MICKLILLITFQTSMSSFLYIVKWFQVFLSDTNYSIDYYQLFANK